MRIRKKKEVTLEPQGFSFLKSNTGASSGVSFLELFVRLSMWKGPGGTLVQLTFLCSSLSWSSEFSLYLAKQPQCFQFFPRMWFLSSLTILVIHLRMHLQCLYYSGLFIYTVRYCFAKNPTARVKAASRGIETTVRSSRTVR